MRFKKKCWVFAAAVLLIIACKSENDSSHSTAAVNTGEWAQSTAVSFAPQDNSEQLRSLDELAELERSGFWYQGLALAESGLRESIGDYAGAVAAAYKELAWAYGLGIIQKEDLEQGLLNVLEQKKEDAVILTAGAILSFARGQWADALAGFGSIFEDIEEPDGFGRWMLLVCSLESNGDDRRTAAAYRSIRARYAQFPEYWYRGARAFSGPFAADYAERCIGIAPSGPFAGECRAILAASTGLKAEDGLSLKTKAEIEEIISSSLREGQPEILGSLLPLISLPDNPYTVYAVGALRALSAAPVYREFFGSQAEVSGGRLAERLAYISRG
ncbi:MAG: hypothetical protein FWG99_00425 [Treponema sp.]|nr:hypothetical protein [Treponema sp.]